MNEYPYTYCLFESQHTLNEGRDTLLLINRLTLLDQVDLILKNDDILEFHDLYSGQMFGGLGLRTGFVTSDEEECSVHDCSSVKHCSHENVVSWTVDEGDVPEEVHCATAAGPLTGRVILFAGRV